MTDAGNEIWKFGGRENKEWSDRRLEESAAGGGVSLSKFLHRPPPPKKKKKSYPFAPSTAPFSLQASHSVLSVYMCVCNCGLMPTTIRVRMCGQ